MRTTSILLLLFICELLNAQSFSLTDNLLLSKITKREFNKNYRQSKESCYKFIDGKEQSPQMDFLIDSYDIMKRISKQWGEDYSKYEEFSWGYYELDKSVSKYAFMVIVDQPINPIAYLIDKNMQMDSVIIQGDGLLTKSNVYFTEQLFDCDETVHLDWYLITDNQVKHIAELEDRSFRYRNISDSKFPSCFADDMGNFYCAIENKQTQKRSYYRIRFKGTGNGDFVYGHQFKRFGR